jgi:signal transduction histidine kinase
VEVASQGGDEIGVLADSFNRMTASLREARGRIERQQSELRAANDELGQKNRDLEEAMRQLRDTQQQLVLSEKMASLGNLVAGVAHEINNPVGAMGSAADTSRRSIEILARMLDEATDLESLCSNQRFCTALDVLKSNNEITSTASGRITDIVQSLKNFARLDESEFQEADVHEGLDSTLTLLHHETKRRIEIVREYGDLPRIECYPNQLNQVFMNVLSNSLHAIDGEGRITVRTRREQDHVVVEIEDTGRGIPQGSLARIFDPGFTTKGVGVGTGLGLSITYSIVRKHEGRIEARSEAGKGTTMTITLPVRQRDTAT